CPQGFARHGFAAVRTSDRDLRDDVARERFAFVVGEVENRAVLLWNDDRRDAETSQCPPNQEGIRTIEVGAWQSAGKGPCHATEEHQDQDARLAHWGMLPGPPVTPQPPRAYPIPAATERSEEDA